MFTTSNREEEFVEIFSIQPKSLDSDSVTLKTSTYTFDGEMKTPEVVVKDGDKALEAGKDYKVSYSNNVNAGTAKAIVTLNGNYSGKLEKTYTIAAKQLGSDAVELKTNRCTYTGKASITLKGNYSSKITKSFTIKVAEDKTYYGGSKKVKVVVK